MFEVSELTVNDYYVCTNYLTEEYEATVGSVTYRIAGKLFADISNTDLGYKVTDGDKIVAFVSFNAYDGDNIMLVNFYVSKDYRFSEAFLLLSKAFDNHIHINSKVYYLPLKKTMSLPSSVCNDGVLDVLQYKLKLKVLEKRWDNGK